MTQKQQPGLKVSKTELKAMMADYEPTTQDDDKMLLIKEAIDTLLPSDKIIFLMYTDLMSEKKVADLLGVSRSPVHSLIVRCREHINNYLKDNTKDD